MLYLNIYVEYRWTINLDAQTIYKGWPWKHFFIENLYIQCFCRAAYDSTTGLNGTRFFKKPDWAQISLSNKIPRHFLQHIKIWNQSDNTDINIAAVNIDIHYRIMPACINSQHLYNKIIRNLRKHTFLIRAWRRLKSVFASAQSDQRLRFLHKETLHPWLSKMHPGKILIRLRECAGWSESSLGALVWSYVFCHSCSNTQLFKFNADSFWCGVLQNITVFWTHPLLPQETDIVLLIRSIWTERPEQTE